MCVMSHSETTLSPLLSLFRESVDHQTERVCVCVCVCVCMRVKSTQGLSKWFKRDVSGLQHMVGSDFLMQIGKDQIKAA